MATGTWEDFTDKYGFSDGASVEQRDFEARAKLVEMLNDHEVMKSAGLRALEYDRPGLHNPCLVVVVKGQRKPTEGLLNLWLAGEIEEVPLRDDWNLQSRSWWPRRTRFDFKGVRATDILRFKSHA